MTKINQLVARALRWLALNGDVLRRAADRLDPQGGGGPVNPPRSKGGGGPVNPPR